MGWRCVPFFFSVSLTLRRGLVSVAGCNSTVNRRQRLNRSVTDASICNCEHQWLCQSYFGSLTTNHLHCRTWSLSITMQECRFLTCLHQVPGDSRSDASSRSFATGPQLRSFVGMHYILLTLHAIDIESRRPNPHRKPSTSREAMPTCFHGHPKKTRQRLTTQKHHDLRGSSKPL